MGQANITTNKNTVPGDKQSPFVTSGLRFGTPAITTRGFKKNEVETLTHWLCDLLDDITNADKVMEVKESVVALCRQFPIYGDR